jgi:ribosomal protein S18 acetylase RimI-like enzyme
VVIGHGRVVGDGGLYFHIQDVIVLPEYQGHGVGRAMMDAIMAYLGRAAKASAFIGLTAAGGKAGFYRRYGFNERAGDAPGMFTRWGSEL